MINANGIHTTGPSTALQPGGKFILFCLFVCSFVVVVQFYKNRENSYLDSGMRADWWKILFLVSSVCQGLDAWDIFPQDGW